MTTLIGGRAVVTGAAMGIGEATARALAARGARVALLDVDPRVADVAASLPDALAVIASVASSEDVGRAVAQIAEAFGGLDLVISNAGITHGADAPSEVEDMSDQEWDAVQEVNLKGTFRIARAAMPHLRRSDGRLICVSSVVGNHQGWPTRVHYAASKAGIEGFVHCLATEVAPYGVTVVGVAPGITRTPQSLDPSASGPETLERIAREEIPLGIPAEPEEIADLIAFLAQPSARVMNGSVVLADSGVSVRSVNKPQMKERP